MRLFIAEKPSVAKAIAAELGQLARVSSLHRCVACGSGLSRRPIAKKKGGFWWSCSGCSNCKQTYVDSKGKPDSSRVKNVSTPKEPSA